MMRSAWMVLALAAACNGNDKDEGDTDRLPDSDTGTEETCGDGVVEGLEDCDFGEANATDGNCLPNCTLNDAQQWALSLSSLPIAAYDAEGVSEATAPLGTGAWKPSDTNQNLDGVVKFQLNIPLYDFRDEPDLQGIDTSAFPELGQITERDVLGTITLADIAEISFQAWHPAGQTPRYYIYLYTQPDGVDDQATWYGRSLYGYSGLAVGLDAPEEQWVTFTTTGGTNRLDFRDKDVDQLTTGDQVALDTLLASPWTWGGDTDDTDAPVGPVDYGSEAVKYVAISTSSGTATSEFDALLDAIVIELKDGRSITVDLEP